MPAASAAVQTTVVLPMGNTAPLSVVFEGAAAKLCVRLTMPQLSVAVAFSTAAVAAFTVCEHLSMFVNKSWNPPGQTMFGNCISAP